MEQNQRDPWHIAVLLESAMDDILEMAQEYQASRDPEALYQTLSHLHCVLDALSMHIPEPRTPVWPSPPHSQEFQP